MPALSMACGDNVRLTSASREDGSTPAAEQGALTLLAGGNAELFQAAQPIFAAIARQYFHLGPSGAGTTMKLVVNTLLGVGMQAVAEAVVLGESAGLNRKSQSSDR